MTVSEILEDIAEQICNDYCRYPREWDEEEHGGQELCESEICTNCPLSRL